MLSTSLLSSTLFLFCSAQQCEDQSWLLGGSSPPLDPLCEYDGSLVPDCQHFLSDLTTSFYHVHQYGQSSQLAVR